MRLAGQLHVAASDAHKRLSPFLPPTTPHETAAARGIDAFATEAAQLPRLVSRWNIEPGPVRESVARLNRIAWEVHRALDRSPRLKPVWSRWARVIPLLRSVTQAIDRLR